MENQVQISGRLTFLGTGTSIGVPMIGCGCEVCHSADPRDRRLRCSSLIETQGKRILIDCGPDFRAQALAHGITRLDALLITHNHYDHLYGLDDVRPLGNTPVYGDKVVLQTIHQIMPYCFGAHKYPGSATVELHEIEAFKPFHVGGVDVLPLPVTHGHFDILGYRIGPLAYITDASFLSEETFTALQGVDTLVLNALRMTPHPSHFSLAESIEAAERIAAKRTFFIHFSHDIGLQAQTERMLPAGMFMAYDGLQIEW